MKNVENTIASKFILSSVDVKLLPTESANCVVIPAKDVISNRHVVVNTETLVEYIAKLSLVSDSLRANLILGSLFTSHTFHYVDGILYDSGLEDEECEWTFDEFRKHYDRATWAILPLDVSRQLNGDPAPLEIASIKNYYHQYLLFTGSRQEDVVLTAGAACVLHGVRFFTSDLDVSLPNDTYLKYLNVDTRLPLHLCNGTVVISWDEYIDLHPATGMNFGDTVFVDGVCVLSPEALLRQKLQMDRPKDQNDIVMLQAMCGRRKVEVDCFSEEIEEMVTEGIPYTMGKILAGKPNGYQLVESGPVPLPSNIIQFGDKSKPLASGDIKVSVLQQLNDTVADCNAEESTVVGFVLIVVCEDTTLFSAAASDNKRSVLARVIGEMEVMQSTLVDSIK